MKQQLVMDQAVVKETIEKTLTSDKGLKFWKKAFKDPNVSRIGSKKYEKGKRRFAKRINEGP